MIGTTLLGTSHISHPGLMGVFESMILRTSRERWDMCSRSLEGAVLDMYNLFMYLFVIYIYIYIFIYEIFTCLTGGFKLNCTEIEVGFQTQEYTGRDWANMIRHILSKVPTAIHYWKHVFCHIQTR